MRRALRFLLPVGGLLLGACADDSGVPAVAVELSASEVEAVTAGCDALRGAANDRTATINGIVSGISGRSPEERFDVLRDGYEQMATLVSDWEAERVRPSFAGLAESAVFDEQLDAGGVAARAELADEQQRFVAAYPAGEIADDDVQGAVGELFNSVEKVNSSLRVRPAAVDREAVGTAFAAAPSCDHVSERAPATP